jgi:hypothetical protein
MDQEILLEIVFNNKSNSLHTFEKVLNLNNKITDWFDIHRINSFIEVLVIIFIFIFYIILTQIKTKLNTDIDSKGTSIHNLENNDKLVNK